MRKHTIRQWHVDPSDDLDAPRVLDHAGAVVAVLPEGSNDARLIAAAPDLLASLKEAIEIIEKHVPRDALGVDHMGDFSVPGGVMTWGVLDEHLHYMRQAIKKAEARS